VTVEPVQLSPVTSTYARNHVTVVDGHQYFHGRRELARIPHRYNRLEKCRFLLPGARRNAKQILLKIQSRRVLFEEVEKGWQAQDLCGGVQRGLIGKLRLGKIGGDGGGVGSDQAVFLLAEIQLSSPQGNPGRSRRSSLRRAVVPVGDAGTPARSHVRFPCDFSLWLPHTPSRLCPIVHNPRASSVPAFSDPRPVSTATSQSRHAFVFLNISSLFFNSFRTRTSSTAFSHVPAPFIVCASFSTRQPRFIPAQSPSHFLISNV
jgi:hypothetical protein